MNADDIDQTKGKASRRRVRRLLKLDFGSQLNELKKLNEPDEPVSQSRLNKSDL
jgi:hypothetical protein